MKCLIRLLCIYWLMGVCVWAQSTAASYFIPTDIGTNAHTIGRANVLGFSYLANSVFDNPGALYRIKKISTSVFVTSFMDEVGYQNASVAMRLPMGVMAIGYMSAGVMGIPKTVKYMYGGAGSSDYDFVQSGTYAYQNSVYTLGYQLSQNKYFHWGISAVYYNTVVDTFLGSGFNANLGLAMDFGALSGSFVIKNVIPGQKVRFTSSQSGVLPGQNNVLVDAVTNKYLELIPVDPNDPSKGYYQSFGNETETLPLETIYGVQYRMGEYRLLGQARMSDANRNLLKSAGLAYRPAIAPMFELSGGYREFSVLKDVKSSITAGVGIQLGGLSFDYAYETSSYPQFDGKHYFSFGYSL